MCTAYQIEAQRIANYARGWNDAQLGRAPRSDALSYVLGFLDSKR